MYNIYDKTKETSEIRDYTFVIFLDIKTENRSYEMHKEYVKAKKGPPAVGALILMQLEQDSLYLFLVRDLLVEMAPVQ